MSLSGRDFRVAVAAFLFAALPGCKQILGLHDREVSDDPPDGGTGVVITPVSGQCGPVRHPSATCAACMDEKCCVEASACHDDPTCDPAFDCNMMCGDDGACRARCNTFFTRSETLVDVNACRESNCRTECGNACGGFGYSAPGCDTCVKQTCCSSAATCAGNAECVRLDLCRTNCIAGSNTCPRECERTFSGGVDDLAPWIGCVQNTCPESCTPGMNWSCLDAKPSWLKPKSAIGFTISVTIVDVLSEKPFVGTTAKACQKLDRDCASPIDVQVSDQNGLVSLTVSGGAAGFDGYIDFTGGDNGEKSPIFPAIWYPSPYIISGGWRGRIQFVSEASLQILAAFTSATIDPTRGHFAANAQDCNFASAPGVSFEADKARDDNTTPFYFINGIPKTDATETDPVSGIGGFINLKAGALTQIKAYARVGENMKLVGGPTYIIRAGTFTTTSIPPTP
jgi:hypothetical protein